MYKNKLRSSNMAEPSLKSCIVDPGDGFQYLSSYQNVSRSKNRNRWKKSFQIFSLPISLRATLKLSLRSRFSAKKYFFAFCRKFGFNIEKLSNHCSQLKKHLKVDPETRSYDILTKTHEKIPTIPNIPNVQKRMKENWNEIFLFFKYFKIT